MQSNVAPRGRSVSIAQSGALYYALPAPLGFWTVAPFAWESNTTIVTSHSEPVRERVVPLTERAVKHQQGPWRSVQGLVRVVAELLVSVERVRPGSISVVFEPMFSPTLFLTFG